MAEDTKISWASHTCNLWWGCTEVHAGCDNCYARTLANRWGFGVWGNDTPRREIASAFKDLARFQTKAKEAGTIRTVFVGSMMDIFEKPMPLVDIKGNPAIDASDGSPIGTDYLRERLFENISAGQYPNLLFLMLTKRPGNINKYIPKDWLMNGAPKNVMFGTSPVDQKTAEKLIPQLLNVYGRLFLSMEPLLGPVDLSGFIVPKWAVERGVLKNPIEWVIVGGESGAGSRPMNPAWAQSLRNQIQDAGIKFHFKQWGNYVTEEQSSGDGYRIIDDGTKLSLPPNYYNVGKHAAGRVLDGVEHNALATD